MAVTSKLFTEPLQSDLTSDQHDRIFSNIDKITDLTNTFRALLHARLMVRPCPSSATTLCIALLDIATLISCNNDVVGHSFSCGQPENPVRMIGDLLRDVSKTMQGPYTMYCANKYVFRLSL